MPNNRNPELELNLRIAARVKMTLEERQVAALEQIADDAYRIRVVLATLAAQKR